MFTCNMWQNAVYIIQFHGKSVEETWPSPADHVLNDRIKFGMSPPKPHHRWTWVAHEDATNFQKNLSFTPAAHMFLGKLCQIQLNFDSLRGLILFLMVSTCFYPKIIPRSRPYRPSPWFCWWFTQSSASSAIPSVRHFMCLFIYSFIHMHKYIYVYVYIYIYIYIYLCILLYGFVHNNKSINISI